MKDKNFKICFMIGSSTVVVSFLSDRRGFNLYPVAAGLGMIRNKY